MSANRSRRRIGFRPHIWLQRHAQVALSSLGRLVHLPLSTLMTSAVIGISLALPIALHVMLDNLQQVASPTELYSNPVNMFVAGFIGSPAMNMVYTTLESDATGLYARFGSERLIVDPATLERHPGLSDRMGDELVMGIRPGNFEATAVTGPAPDRTITATVTVAEILGSETYVHFELESPPGVTPDIEELLADTGADVSSLGDTTKFTARVSSDVPVSLGQEITVTVDVSKMHFFDPTTGARIGVKE